MLRHLLLHFASKQLVVSEISCFHKRHHEEGGRLLHMIRTEFGNVSNETLNNSLIWGWGKVISHCGNTKVTVAQARKLWKKSITASLLELWLWDRKCARKWWTYLAKCWVLRNMWYGEVLCQWVTKRQRVCPEQKNIISMLMLVSEKLNDELLMHNKYNWLEKKWWQGCVASESVVFTAN